MRVLAITIGLMLSGMSPTASAQVRPGEGTLSSCSDTGSVALVHGSRLYVTCDSVFVYTQVGHRKVRVAARNLVAAGVTEKQKYDSLVTYLTALLALRDSISASKSEVIASMRAIQQAEKTAYDSLGRLTHVIDSLAWVSTRNTDAALRYITRVQVASYVATGLGGGLIGGFATKGSGEAGFNLLGAGIGAGAGMLVNNLVMRVFAR